MLSYLSSALKTSRERNGHKSFCHVQVVEYKYNLVIYLYLKYLIYLHGIRVEIFGNKNLFSIKFDRNTCICNLVLYLYTLNFNVECDENISIPNHNDNILIDGAQWVNAGLLRICDTCYNSKLWWRDLSHRRHRTPLTLLWCTIVVDGVPWRIYKIYFHHTRNEK